MKNFKIYLFLCTLVLFSCKKEVRSDLELKKSFLNYSIQKSDLAQDQLVNGVNNTAQITHSIVSWNIKDFGQSRDDNEIKAIAAIVRNFDIVLIQEVVAKHPGGAQAVARLADQLNRMGAKWDYSISDPTQSPSAYISERYAFLWKTSKATLKGKPFLDKELSSVVYREPYIANFIFKDETKPITLINYHSRKYDDHPENEIRYFLDYNSRLAVENVLLCGDFNLDEKHPVWDSFYNQGYKNALSDKPTTLKMKCKNGQYLNHSIDNIFGQGDFTIIKAGSLDFIKNCDNLIEARQLSDHLPVFVNLTMH